jgi:hypothetical protein
MELKFGTITKTFQVIQFNGTYSMAREIAYLLGDRPRADISKQAGDPNFVVEFENAQSEEFKLKNTDWLVKEGHIFRVYTNESFENFFDKRQLKTGSNL